MRCPPGTRIEQTEAYFQQVEDYIRQVIPPSELSVINDNIGVPGNINLSVGNGQVDFDRGLKALADAGYHGHFSLELETRDITHDERPASAAQAGQLISALI